MRTLSILPVLLLLLAGCEKEKLSNGHSDLVVVEGYLYAGRPVDSIRLSKAVTLNSTDTLFTGISDATVSITSGGNNYNLLPSSRAGYYYYPGSDLSVSAGNTYGLNITYQGIKVSSETTVPAVPASLQISGTTLWVDTTLDMRQLRDSSLLVKWNNPGMEYYFVILENKDTALTQITFTNPFGGDGGPVNFVRRFRTMPIQDSLYRINLFNTVAYYGHYEFKLYRVNAEYAKLYQSRSQSSINLNEPFTNIENGLGIFTAFSQYDSIFFDVKKK
ncbi:MAG TPA: DUF4249 domain-containing protein [Bacteroidales bacterium]|nr:DUF4249 domain-containing protein [Bacteroidales bacterium]